MFYYKYLFFLDFITYSFFMKSCITWRLICKVLLLLQFNKNRRRRCLLKGCTLCFSHIVCIPSLRRSMLASIIESQSGLGCKGPYRSSSSTPLPWQEHLPPDQVAQSTIQPSLEHCVLGLARTGLIFTRIQEGTQPGGLTPPGQTEQGIPYHVPSCGVPVGGNWGAGTHLVVGSTWRRWFGRAALWAVRFVLCFPLICIAVVPGPSVCCSVKLPLS